ncbi:MAG: glycerol-3-phosphate 1-O-acyltransferase PlsY [Bryobacterales bacterium]|nr:glycerol-3-phosphate 1-O-acyltransferase PlsY [Bryobacterales bacterium]
MKPLIALIAAYLLGGIPFGFLLVRLKTGRDVRQSGSGNIGATNVLRTSGRALGVLTLMLDVAKGFAAVWVASWLTGANPLWVSAAALAVALGHAFPAFLGFHGGKAAATSVGAWAFLTPLPLLATVVVFVIAVAATRYISLGSILGAAAFPLAVFLIQHPPAPVVVAAILGAAFVVWRHKSNIARLRAGAENVFRFGGTKH